MFPYERVRNGKNCSASMTTQNKDGLYQKRELYPIHLSLHFTFEFKQTDFRKKKYSKFHENLSSGSGVVPRGQTDRHDETKSFF